MLRLADQYFVEELGKSTTSQQYLRDKRHLSDEIVRMRGL